MKVTATRCLPLTLLLWSNLLAAQNLVPNGSFEEYLVCPGGYSQNPSEFRVNSWRSLTFGSPDYFNSCSEGEAAVPYNWAGVADAYDGFGYVGIYTWLDIKDYREYLHCKLLQPLIKDSVYQVEFRYKLSSYSKYSTDRIAVLLSDSLVTTNNDRPLRFSPSVSFVKDSALTPETGSWELAAAEYKAKGDERFLTIGNFADNENTGHYFIKFRPAAEPMLAGSAYYYIDDVKVVPKYSEPPTTERLPVFTGADPELNATYVLQNIQFEFNSYALLPESYFDLDILVKYLLANPDISVELSGHTDERGDEGYNQRLSENRARSAADYLISKGVGKKRIATRGFGESQPLVSGSGGSIEINRRVEIVFRR